MKILLLGTGAREHALALRLSQSPSCTSLFWARPNAAPLPAHVQPAEITPDSPEDVRRWCEHNSPSLVVAGGESPLCAGVGDAVRQIGIPFFGPSQADARLEGSKIFAKNKMTQWGVPTAAYTVAHNINQAREFLDSQPDCPWVVKADGLAAGKGVIITPDKKTALAAAADMLERGLLGRAGNSLVMEEFLKGEEFSVHCLISGGSAEILPLTQDHKRVGEGDTGPNTGGMGAYGPVPQANRKILTEIRDLVVAPILAGLRSDGMDYRGVLYIGIMQTAQGPRVLEFNCRFGDPECQVLMQLLGGDLAQILYNVAVGRPPQKIPINPGYAACVVLASEGYPASPRTGDQIFGLDAPGDCQIYHAGTRCTPEGIVTAGGRVLSVVSLQPTLKEALDKIYSHISKIHFRGMHYRRDIAHRAMNSFPQGTT